jgi:hypothetical protein
MHRKQLYLMTVLMIVSLSLAACGGGSTPAPSSGNAPAQNAPAEPTAAPAQPAAQTPQELGDEIGKVYVGALEDVAQLVADKPPAAEVKTRVAELKEQVIQQLVALGKKREAMSAADRKTVTARISMALGNIGSADWYTKYSEAVSHYNKEDSELSTMLASFNIIGQYAQFELLKQQEPKEAERLGIK